MSKDLIAGVFTIIGGVLAGLSGLLQSWYANKKAEKLHNIQAAEEEHKRICSEKKAFYTDLLSQCLKYGTVINTACSLHKSSPQNADKLKDEIYKATQDFIDYYFNNSGALYLVASNDVNAKVANLIQMSQVIRESEHPDQEAETLHKSLKNLISLIKQEVQVTVPINPS